MQGYQTIPDSSLETVEYGSASMTPREETSGQLPTSMSSMSMPTMVASLTSKFGYIFLGIVLGYCNSSGSFSGKLNHFGSTDDADNAMPSMHHGRARLNSDDDFIINGKSFLDSLPFEEIIPKGMNNLDQASILHPMSWNPAQPSPTKNETNVPNTLSRESKLLSTSVSASLSAPLISNSGSSSSSSSSRISTPHLLYHAHPSAFSLLYSSSNGANSYISEYATDYFLLNSGGFDAQINQAYCAVASVAAVLNSLKYGKRYREGDDVTEWSFDLPIDSRYKPYAYATQQDILTGDCVWENVIEHGDGSGDNGPRGGNVDGIFKPPYGLSLEQASKLLKCHTSDEWVVTVQQVDPSHVTLSKMRFDLKAALIDPDARVLINYDRKALSQVGGGHFSPLGAYNAATDSFLIMDVAKYKYPPVWVGADTLFDAMATVDNCGTYDYPKAQEKLVDNNAPQIFSPITKDDYAKALDVLGCQSRMRGYVILNKKIN